VKLTIGLSLSLSGPYAPMGRQAEAALRMWAADAHAAGGIAVGGERAEVALDCHDDQSDAARCAEIYRAMCGAGGADLIFGPYSSALATVAAEIAERAGRVFVNHGGAADHLHERGYRMIVSVLSPASDYLTGFVRLLGSLKFWRKRLAIVAAPTPFARAVAAGVERAASDRAARRHGVRVRVKWNGAFDPAATPAVLFPALRRNRVNALVSAGSFEHDLAVIRAAAESHLSLPVLACVAAGVARFRDELGELAEGVVGPSQWEIESSVKPELGPSPREFARRMRTEAGVDDPDYVGAQAYAAGLLAAAAIGAAGGLDQERIRAAFSGLRTATLFGDFAIDPRTGRQLGHQMTLVQWHGGRKIIIEPEPNEDAGSLEFPSGWRILLAGLDMLKLNRNPDDDDERRDDFS
jgi:branched-chain amino acid transport system substrate-binding protein